MNTVPKKKRGCLRVILLILLLLALAAGWAISPYGILRKGETWLNEWLSETLGGTVLLKDVTWKRPLIWSAARLSWIRPDGTEIEIERARIDLAVRPLLKRTLQVRSMYADEVRLRTVTPAATAPATATNLTQGIRVPEWLLLDEVEVNHGVWIHEMEQPVEWSLRGTLHGNRARLDADISSVFYHTRASGLLELDLHTLQAEGTLRAEVSDLSAWAGRMEWDAEGAASVEVQLAVVDEAQHLVAQAHLRDGRMGEFRQGNATVKLEGTLQEMHFAVTGEGQSTSDLRVHAEGMFSVPEGRVERLRFETLSAAIGNNECVLLQPVEWTHLNERYVIDVMKLRILDGELTVAGTWGADAMDLQADVEDFPLSRFGFAGVSSASGNVEGALRITGSPAHPIAEGRLTFADLMPTQTNDWAGAPAQFSVAAQWVDQRLDTQFLLEGLTGEPVRLSIHIPLKASFYPFAFEWPPVGPVEGSLRARTDLAEATRLFVLDVHRLTGEMTVDVQLSGTVEKPELKGALRVREGSYENDRTGTVLRKADVDIVAKDHRLEITHAVFTDGLKGRVEWGGEWRFSPLEHYPFSVRAKFDTFRLWYNDTGSAIGSGELKLEGDSVASRVTGTMTLSPVELLIPERIPASLIDLDEVYVGEDAHEQNGTTADSTLDAVGHQMELDITLLFPERVFLRGRGLDSEWSGNVRVTGGVAAPSLTGVLSVTRGRFVFFGKRLSLTRGVITFNGTYPPEPQLQVLAEARSGGINALLHLQGELTAPAITLESVPPLPEDEILARMLFGRAAARISPIQALTMAQAVNSLRGGGSAFDFMGRARRLLRVDQIELRDSEEQEGQAAVRVGKYINDRVYLQLERGATESGGRAGIEVELTPTIRLESEIGANADAALGINWTWDY